MYVYICRFTSGVELIKRDIKFGFKRLWSENVKT